MLLRLLATSAVLWTGCDPTSRTPPDFDGEAAMRYVQEQLTFGPRIPGTEGHRQMAAWLDSLLRERADSVLVQAWDHTEAGGAVLPMRNFIARFNPGARERLLFLAHWDTRPRADGRATP